MLPDNCENIDNLDTFKNKVKKWKPENCPCRLYKIYINNIEKEKQKLGIVVFLKLWLLLASIVLIPIRQCSSFYRFLQPIAESIGFQGFCIQIKTSQLAS